MSSLTPSSGPSVGPAGPSIERAALAAVLREARPRLERDLRRVLPTRGEETLAQLRALLEGRGFEVRLHDGVLVADAPHPGRTLAIHHRVKTAPLGAPPRSLVATEEILEGRGVSSGLGALIGAVHASGHLAPGLRMRWVVSLADLPPSREALATAYQGVEGALLATGTWPGSRPAALVGARGRLSVRLSLSTGGPSAPEAEAVAGLARNPLAELAALVSRLADPATGAPSAPELRLGAEDMTIAEAQHFALSGFELRGFAEGHDLRLLRHSDPLEAMEALWALPSLELLDLESTCLPGQLPAEARATLAYYLVPNMRAADVMERLVERIHLEAPEVCVEHLEHEEPWLGRMHGPLAEAVREAYRVGFGSRAALVRRAPPLPEAARIQSLGVPVVCASGERPEHRAGSPEEHLPWSDLVSTVTVYAQLLSAWSARLG